MIGHSKSKIRDLTIIRPFSILFDPHHRLSSVGLCGHSAFLPSFFFMAVAQKILSELERGIDDLKLRISEDDIENLCAIAKDILLDEPNVKRLDSPITVHLIFSNSRAHR
jgi:hypothetical protein